MNKLTTIASIFFLSLLEGCSDGSGHDPLPVAETTVRLEGAIGLSATRAVIDSGYEKDLEVCFARQDETTGSTGAYGMWKVCEAVRLGGGGNRPITFAESQLYPADGTHIRLHGYYPAGEQVVIDSRTGKATFSLDGVTDIMATGSLTATTYDPVRTCTFRHLLTQVALVCYSDRAEQWGAVTKIEAVDICTAQQLAWQSETPQLTGALDGPVGKVAVRDINGLLLPQIGEDEELPEVQGYILLPVLPADGTVAHPLQFEVTTAEDGKGNETATVSHVSVSVDGGFLLGKRHVVSLFFTDGRKIQAASVGVEQWTDKDAGEIPI